MSNQLYMDESNGNGIYANKLNGIKQSVDSIMATATAATTTMTNLDNNPVMTTTTTSTTNSNVNHIMNTSANPTTTANTNGTNGTTATLSSTQSSSSSPPLTAATTANPTLPASASTEDLSQSLSEYTDADESISAPTEFLAEFLSAVMLKDYKKALKYCKLILQYEPNNTTAKEFYPLILDKLQASSDSDENYNKSSSPEYFVDLQSAYPSTGDSDEADFDEAQAMGEGADDELDGNSNGSALSSGSCSAGESLSVSMDEDEDDIDDDDDEDGENVDIENDERGGDVDSGAGDHININNFRLHDVDNDDNEHDVGDDNDDDASSSGDELPIDDTNDVCIGLNLDLASHSSHNSSSGAENRSRSDNTTHSYSSLLLEEEDDLLAANVHLTKSETLEADLDVSNGNKIPSTSCSDSESPTEPLTQRLAAILLSKCGVSSKD